MIFVKLSAADGKRVAAASSAFAAAGEQENKHRKAKEAAKQILTRELKELRGIVLEELPAGELVVVQIDGRDALKVDRRASQRLDGPALGAAHPNLVEEFTKPSVASYFTVLGDRAS